MTVRISTGLRNFLNNFGNTKQALTGGVLRVYSGSQPADADTAVAGTKLLEITLASGAWTSEVLSSGTVTLTGGAAGSVDTLTVNSVSILPAAVAYNASLTQTATDLATAINAYTSSPNYKASASGAVVTISAMPGTGTGPNTYVVASTATTITKTDANMAGGVAAVNGLKFGASAAGVISKSGTWSGTVLATGTAGCFRFTGSEADANGASTTLLRLDGSCGVGSGDLQMSSTSLTIGAPHTVDTFTVTVPAT